MANKQPKKKVVTAATQQKINIVPAGRPATFSLSVKLALLLGIVSFILYANTLRNGFVMDDENAITNNTLVARGMSAIPQLLTTPYHWGVIQNSSNDLYRPLSLVMFAVEYQFFGKNPAPYHFINILLFAGCVMLLFLFLNSFFEGKRIAVAFIASLLFALHPIHTEVVANIKSRDELLCFFFAFLSLLTFYKYSRTGKTADLLLGSTCFLLSVLSKETVVTFMAVIPLIFFFYNNENRKRSIYITAGAAIATAICFAIRISVLSSHHSNEMSNVLFIDNALAKAGLSFESKTATAILILGYYIKLLFIPIPLHCDYSFNAIPFTHFTDPLVILSLALYIFIAAYSIRALLKGPKNPYAFALLFFLITISLFTNIPFIIGTTMGERLIFFPSVGFCLLAALFIDKLGPKSATTVRETLSNPKILAIIVPVCLVYCALTINRNGDWLNNYTLYKTDLEKAPGNSRLNYDLGYEIAMSLYDDEKDPAKQKQLIAESIPYFRKAIEIHPDYGNAHLNLGRAFFLVGEYDSTEAHEKRAITLDPGNVVAITNLGAAYFVKQKYHPALESYLTAISLDPASADAPTWHFDVGCSYLNTKQYDSAIFYFKKTQALDPKFKDVNMKLGVAYFQEQKYQDAEQQFKKVLELDPANTDAKFNLTLINKMISSAPPIKTTRS